MAMSYIKKEGLSLCLFCVIIFFLAFASSTSVDDLIDSGLQNEISVNVSSCNGDISCEQNLVDDTLSGRNQFDVNCDADPMCVEIRNRYAEANLTSQDLQSDLNNFLENQTVQNNEEVPVDSVKANVSKATTSKPKQIVQKNITAEFSKNSKKATSLSFWQKFLKFLNGLQTKITGNAIYIESNFELPVSPVDPGNYQEISSPILSKSKFRIFNFFTGNVIYGIPDWSFDGTDEKNGNFIWDAEYTPEQGGLQHFDLKLDINFSKKDSNQKAPVNGIIYQKAYYLNEQKGKWIDFNWTGAEIWSSSADAGKNVPTGWLRAGVNGQPTPSASLTLQNFTKEDYAVFLAYSCLKFSEKDWQCNEGKWVVFIVETGDVDYHSVVGSTPKLDYKEIKDLNISDLPSILKQMNLTLLSFQPELYDVFITEANSDINSQEGKVEVLEFYVRNFGNRNLMGLNYQIDIGEGSLAEVVSADLPKKLSVGEMKKGSVSVLLKQNHSQKITLWIKTDQPEVDTSDNMAIYNVLVGKKQTAEDIPNRVPYHGDDGTKIINWSKVEPYEERNFAGDSDLNVISGVDKVRTIFGGYWNGTSINPTMNVVIWAPLTEEALFSTPFVSSISIGGNMLTGEREVVKYKVKFTDSKTGVYYETPEMESSYKYHYNPKDLIPDFKFCNDYEIETTLTSSTEETIDVIHEEKLNICNKMNIYSVNYFKTKRLQKLDGNYVIVTPYFDSRNFENLNVSYLVEFKDPKSNATYRTSVLNIAEGAKILRANEIFGNRNIDYGYGEAFNGNAILLQDLKLKDIEDMAFEGKYRVSGRDCSSNYNGKDYYGYSNLIGLTNWQELSQDKLVSDKFLCYNDKFFQCGSGSFGSLSNKTVGAGTIKGSWECTSAGWNRSISANKVLTINPEKGVKQTIMVSHDVADCNGTVFRDDSGILLCDGVPITLRQVTEPRDVYIENQSAWYNIKQDWVWNGWDMNLYFIIYLKTRLIMKDEKITGDYSSRSYFYESGNFKNSSWSDNSLRFESPRNYEDLNSYMDRNMFSSILKNTTFSLVLYDLTEKNISFSNNINMASGNYFIYFAREIPKSVYKNGHVYEIRVVPQGEYAMYYAPILPKYIYYINGWDFALNNQFLYSRFLGFPANLNADYYTNVQKINGSFIPSVILSYHPSNAFLNPCTGNYEKVDVNNMFVDMIGECKSQYGTYVDYNGSQESLFDTMTLTLSPFAGSGQVSLNSFNCKIGKFDGICYRSDYGMKFDYVDARNNMLYSIEFAFDDNHGKGGFLVKYRDASNLGTSGNKYDALLYDVLTRIDSYPIKDFDIDNTYPYLKVNNGGDFSGLSSSKGREDYYKIAAISSQKIVSIPDLFFLRGYANNISVYDDNFNYLGIVPVFRSRFSGSYSSMESKLGFKNGQQFIGFWFNSSFGYDGDYRYNSIYLSGLADRSLGLIFVNNYSELFFNKGLNKYLVSPSGLNVSYDPLRRSWVGTKTFNSDGLTFNFAVDAKNSSLGKVNTKEDLDNLINYVFYSDYQNATDFNNSDQIRRPSSDWSLLSIDYKNSSNSRLDQLGPGIVDKYGTQTSREYNIVIKSPSDIYGFFEIAPKNCQNAYNSSGVFRDVICSSYKQSINSGSRFVFSCSWANINDLKVYRVTMYQNFPNRTLEQINNLPSATINDMKNEFFHPVLNAYLEALPPTPILNTTYGTFDQVSLCA